MKKRSKLSILCALAMLVMAFSVSVQAAGHKKGDEVKMGDQVIGVYDAKGRIVFQKQDNEDLNKKALNQLTDNDKKKTIVIPKKMTVNINSVWWIGDNTTIIAEKGAKIIQTTDGTGILSNRVHTSDYKSLKNVTIQGGTWKNKVNKSVATTMRFAMGSNIKITGATVETNYKGHAIELIACKDVTVKNCTLTAKNASTSTKTSVEEALQIDIATPKTAPGVKNEGAGKYLKGQTCKNITVTGCTISGSRGLCVNWAASESKYQGKFHDNIVIKNNKLTGKTSEACALFNTLNATIEGNTITTNSSRTKESYSVGLNIQIMGKAPSAINKALITVKKNTIKGGRQGLNVATHKGSKYNKMVVTGNKMYAVAGKSAAMVVSRSAVKTVSQSGNSLYKWTK